MTEPTLEKGRKQREEKRKSCFHHFSAFKKNSCCFPFRFPSLSKKFEQVTSYQKKGEYIFLTSKGCMNQDLRKVLFFSLQKLFIPGMKFPSSPSSNHISFHHFSLRSQITILRVSFFSPTRIIILIINLLHPKRERERARAFIAFISRDTVS